MTRVEREVSRQNIQASQAEMPFSLDAGVPIPDYFDRFLKSLTSETTE